MNNVVGHFCLRRGTAEGFQNFPVHRFLYQGLERDEVQSRRRDSQGCCGWGESNGKGERIVDKERCQGG
jgi:hypothetical protein